MSEETELEKENNGLLPEHEALLKWFETVRFNKMLIGGISERDLLRKLDQLNELYKQALIAERARYNSLLSDRVDEFNRILRTLKKQQAESREANSGDNGTN